MKKIITFFLLSFLLLSNNTANAVLNSFWTTDMATRWSTMSTNNHAFYQNLLSYYNSADDANNGVRACILYKITGNSTYATTAYNRFATDIYSTADRNKTRDGFTTGSFIFSVCGDGVGATAKADMKSRLTTYYQKVTAQGSYSTHGTRLADTDELFGHYMGLMMFATALKDEDPALASTMMNYQGGFDLYQGSGKTVKMGGLDVSATDNQWNNARNRIQALVQSFLTGGEWVEGSYYSANTLKYMVMGALSINSVYGVDKFPEITALIDEMADAHIEKWAPGFGNFARWGDVQDANDNNARRMQALLHLFANADADHTLRYVANQVQYTTAAASEEFLIYAYPCSGIYEACTAPSGQTDHHASGMGIVYHHQGWGTSSANAFLFSQFKPKFIADHDHHDFSNFKIWRGTSWAVTNPDQYSVGDDDSLFYRNSLVVNGAFPRKDSEAKEEVGYAVGTNYVYHAGLAGGRQNQPGTSVGTEHLKEWMRSHLYRVNADDSVTLIIFDRLDALDPTLSQYGTGTVFTEVNAGYNSTTGRHSWNIHTEVSPSKTGDRWTWTAANGQTTYLDTKMSGYTESILTPTQLTSTYATTILAGQAKYLLRLLMPKTPEFQTYLNFVHQGSNPTTSKFTSNAGEAAVAGYYTAGSENVLAIFSAKQVTYPTSTSGTSYQPNSGRIDLLKPLRYFATGYTFTQTFGTNPIAYFMDLNPAYTWKYKIDGGAEQSLSVNSTGFATANLTMSSGSHTLAVYKFGEAIPDPCASSCSSCNASNCLTTGPSCYLWSNNTCNATAEPAACSPSNLQVCSQSQCGAINYNWCDDSNIGVYNCQQSACTILPFLAEADPQCYLAYNFSETSGDVLDVCSTDAVSDAGTVSGNPVRSSGQYYVLDGTGDYITIPDSAENDFGASSYSVCAKVKMGSTTGNQTLWSKGYFQSANKSWGAYLSDATVNASTFDASNSSTASWLSGAVTSDYQYLCAVKNTAAGTLNLYENATLRSSIADSVGTTTGTLPLLIGAYCSTSNSSFPTTSVLDNFNRANEGPPLSSGWTTPTYSSFTGLKVSSNAAIMNVTGGFDAVGYWNASNFGPDTEVYAKIGNKNGSDAFLILHGRFDVATGNGYKIDWDAFTSRIRVWRVDAGTRTQLGSNITQAMATGDSLGMSIIGSTITVWYKASAGSWTQLATRTDSTYSSAGKIMLGLWLSGAGTTIDDFGGGTVVSSTQCPNTTTPQNPSMEIDDFFIFNKALTTNEMQGWINAGGLTESTPTDPAPTIKKLQGTGSSGAGSF